MSTIMLTAVVGASLVRFPFGASQAGQATPTTSSLAAATLTGAAPAPSPGPSHEIEVVTRPSGARVTVIPDGAAPAVAGHSPLTATVGAGTVEIRVTHDGRATRTEHVTVDGDRTFTWWLDPKGQAHHKVGQFEAGDGATRVAFAPGGRQVWVAGTGGPGITVHRPRSGEQVGSVDLGSGGAADLLFSPDGTTAWASQPRTGTVHEIDTATRTVRRLLAVGDVRAGALALSPDGRRLFVANPQQATVSEVDLATGEVARSVPTVATPRDLLVTDDALYVAGAADGALARIDLAGGAATTLTWTGGALRHLAVDVEQERLYAADAGTGTVFAHDLGTTAVSAFTDTLPGPRALALSAGGRVLYVAGRTPDGDDARPVRAVDAATGDVLDRIAAERPDDVAVSGDDGLLAVLDATRRVHVYEIPPAASLLVER